MKATRLSGILALLLCAICLTSCLHDENDEGEKVTGYQEYELTVASKRVLGIMDAGCGSSYIRKLYAVRKEGAQEWQSFHSIQDFDYEEGYEYRIRISETSYLDYRRGEPSWTEYKLLEIISKTERESEGLPDDLLPDDYGCMDVELRYVIEADNKEEVETRLKKNYVPFRCRQYVFNQGLTQFAMLDEESEYLVLADGALKRETHPSDAFPDSYELIPLEGQVMLKERWTFLIGHVSDRAALTMDAFVITLPGSSGNSGGTRAQVWLYQDLTQFAQEAFPDAGVKTVVLAQIFGVSAIR